MTNKLQVRLSFILILILVLSFSVPVKALASEEESKTVKVGYYQNEVFEDGASEDSVKTGYAYEYYRKISEYTGWNYEYIYGDFVTIYQMLLDGQVDVVAGLAYTEDRRQLIYYPDKPMGAEKYGIVKHEDDTSFTSDVSTLRHKKIGVLDSAIVGALHTFLSEKNVDAQVVTFNDYGKLMEAFDSREVDVIAAEIDGIYARNHAEVIYSFGSTDYYLCVSKYRPDLLKELNLGQEQLYAQNPDYLSYLRNKYYSTALSSRALTEPEADWLAEHGTLKIGYLDNLLPYSDTDKNGKPTGMVTEVFSDIFRNLGIENLSFEYVGFSNYEDMVAAVNDGTVDTAYPMGGGLYYSEKDGLLLSDKVNYSLNDLVYNDKSINENLSDFAVNQNNKLQYYYIKNNYPESNVKMYDSTEACLEAVSSGDATFTIINGLRTNSLLKKGSYNNLSFLQLYFEDDLSFGVRIGNNGLLELLNRGISVTGVDYFQNLAFRHSENMSSYTFKDFFRQYALLFVVIIIAVAALIVFLLVRDILRTKKRIAEKEQAAEELEKANREKFVFVNKMANYMREPVRNMGKLMEQAKGEKDSKTKDEYIEGMRSYNNELKSIINNILNLSRYESGQIQLEDRNITRHFAGRRMLIVEDNLQNRMITGRILKSFGFEIQAADSGAEACDRLNAAPEGYFDAVIMDFDIADKVDVNDARQIRNLNNEGKANIPIIALYSGDSDNLSSLTSQGLISAVIKKPFDVDIMTEVFSKVLVNRGF